MGSAIAQIIANYRARKSPSPESRNTEVFVEHGSRDRLLREFGLDPEW